ncbi:hypothetical protein EVAR_29772_1 [Eumeta japonica]|uniref:Uncharacterized protein n=1 Tax=Eumeta variegata TaxID=151549 RepID=A0A4C1WVM1_EUMVA|nr:hypothetical protein EVAR_29772_1 [Eumeta japonica]
MLMKRVMSDLMLHILTTLKKNPRCCTPFPCEPSAVYKVRTLKRGGGGGGTRHDGLRSRRCVRRDVPHEINETFKNNSKKSENRIARKQMTQNNEYIHDSASQLKWA